MSVGQGVDVEEQRGESVHMMVDVCIRQVENDRTYQVIQNLVPNDAHHLETLLAAHRVDNHVAMDADEVFRVENAVLVLAGGVDHLDGKVMLAVADDFAESVLDGRVVRVDEVAVDVLHCEGGFACVLVLGFVVVCILFATLGLAAWMWKTYRLICCRRWPSCAVSAGEA